MSGIDVKIDNLGRIVIPIGFRKRLGIDKNSLLMMSIENNKIVISNTENKCAICNEKSEVDNEFKICRACKERIIKAAFDQ